MESPEPLVYQVGKKRTSPDQQSKKVLSEIEFEAEELARSVNKWLNGRHFDELAALSLIGDEASD